MQIEFHVTKQIERDPESRVVENMNTVPVAIDHKARAAERRAKQGRFAWDKKHRYDGCDPQWHELWILLIPGFGCDCQQDFVEYCKSDPPDFSSPEAYFAWGVRLHNWVNRKLQKAEMTFSDALQLWGRSFDSQIQLD